MHRGWLCALAAFGMAGIAHAGTISGSYSPVDVDSFYVGGVEVRLNGVDGPEATGNERPAGLEAASYLEKLIGSKPLVCISNGEKTHGRAVVSCTLDGRDLGETIIKAGYARECLRYSLGRYTAAEKEARDAKRGLWGKGVMPEMPKAYCIPS